MRREQFYPITTQWRYLIKGLLAWPAPLGALPSSWRHIKHMKEEPPELHSFPSITGVHIYHHSWMAGISSEALWKKTCWNGHRFFCVVVFDFYGALRHDCIFKCSFHFWVWSDQQAEHECFLQQVRRAAERKQFYALKKWSCLSFSFL